MVDGNDDGAVEGRGGADVGAEVFEAAADGRQVGGGERVTGRAAVHFQGADGGDDDDGVGGEAGLAAFDVDELFAAEIEGETGLGDDVIGEGEGHAGGEDGVAAVGDVGERASVDKGRDAFG